MTDDLQKRHMQVWGRVAQMARRCIELQQQGCDSGESAFLVARKAMLAELVTLIDLSQQLDNEGPMWRRCDIYMTGAKGMLASCGVSMQEIEVYRSRSVDGDSVEIS